MSITEGSFTRDSYPETTTVTSTVQAGQLPLDPTSFRPDPTNLQSLLDELSSDITSSGEPVTFRYDEETNTIIGEASDGEVLRIEIDAQPAGGGNVTLSITTTVLQPIDHVPSVGEGSVSIVDDTIEIGVSITGQDTNGNELLSPIDVNVQVQDGDVPTATPAIIDNVESNSATLSGTLFNIGSDELQNLVFDPAALDTFEGILSDNQPTVATLSEDGTTLILSVEGSETSLLEITLGTDGSFTFNQTGPIEHPQSDGDISSFVLPVSATDFDGDSVDTTLTVNVLDGANPVVNSVTGVTLSETNLPDGTDPDPALLVGTGVISATAGSDAIDHYEVDVTAFNENSTITAFGQPVNISGPTLVDDEYLFTGTAIVDGEVIDVFTVSLDSEGNYRFELLQPLDHTGDNDDSLSFNLPVVAIDTDGDPSSLGENSNIIVTVLDDAPVINDDAYIVIEPTTDGQNEISHQIISAQGADGASVVSFVYKGDTETTYTLNPNVTGEQSFDVEHGTLYVTIDGEMRFVPDRNLDHSESESILSSVEFTVRDSDGDERLSTVGLTTIDGQTPNIESTTPISLNEANLDDGTDPGAALISGSGVVKPVVGSDDIDHYEVDVTTFNSNGEITSMGLPVMLGSPIEVTDPITGDVSFVYTASVKVDNMTTVDVFQFTIDENGNYDFVLYESLDHDPDSGEDTSLNFNIPVFAIDSDNDPSGNANVVVSVADDSLPCLRT
ncbi:hypothetical protein JCM19233_673 [Vibrio astriarenae]|nr:hypothetical protein JCM19233_673 [Vibrio sp. C7]